MLLGMMCTWRLGSLIKNSTDAVFMQRLRTFLIFIIVYIFIYTFKTFSNRHLHVPFKKPIILSNEV